MSSRSKAWLVAATIGAVEASKDQLGLCRWNYMIRSVNQRIRNNVRSATQANRFSSSSTTVVASGKDGDKAKKAEESLRTIMSMVTRRLEITARPHLLVSLSITHLHLVDRDANFNLDTTTGLAFPKPTFLLGLT
ncbi:hypothetical protein YC2023_076447 [Brassica napus]